MREGRAVRMQAVGVIIIKEDEIMDLEKIYETVVLRDIFEYMVPGAITLTAICILIEAIITSLGLGFSVFNTIIQGGLNSALVIAPIAYVLGHHLTEMRYIAFRAQESNITVDLLAKDQALKMQAVQAITEYIHITEQEALDILAKSTTAENMREVGRALIYHRLPLLHREFVARHSILSRMAKNISIALTELLLCTIVAAVFLWRQVLGVVNSQPVTTIIAGCCFLGITIVLIALFSKRADKLRRSMTRHTFQIWYADFVQQRFVNTHEPPTIKPIATVSTKPPNTK